MTQSKSSRSTESISVKLGQEQLDQIEHLGVSPSTALRRSIWALHEIKRAESAGGRVYSVSADGKKFFSTDNVQSVGAGKSPIARSLKLDPKSKSVLERIESEYGGELSKKTGRSSRIRTILQIYLELSERSKAQQPWFIDYGNYDEELRIPGFGYQRPLVKKQSWIRKFDSAKGQELVQSYCTKKGFQWIDHVVVDDSPNDGLFIAQTIVIAWFNNSRLIREFVESSTFKKVVEAVQKTRRSVFSKDPKARAAYQLLQENKGVLSTDRFKHLNNYFGEKTEQALSNRPDGSIENSLEEKLVRFSWILKNESMQDPRMLLRLWRYESLDCRSGYWVKRLAKQYYAGELSPLVDTAFRLLARAPNNLWNRQTAFSRLHKADSDEHRNAIMASRGSNERLSSLEDRIHSLSEQDDWGWEKMRPWVFSRDQQVRHVLLQMKIYNLLQGQPLRFSFAAYSVVNEVPNVAWSDADNSVQKCGLANILVTIAAHNRSEKREEDRYNLSGTGWMIPVPQKNGFLVVADTLKRIFAVLVWSDGDHQAHALSEVERFRDAGIDLETLSREKLERVVDRDLLENLEATYVEDLQVLPKQR